MNFLVIMRELTMAAAKVFVEPQDDVVSIAARISKAETDQVVVVIPSGANIITSEVSVKLLSRVITTISKLVVFVTDDILAQKYVIRSNMIAIEKVSDINRETWQSALDFKQQQLQKKNERKSELLNNRNVKSHKVIDFDQKQNLTNTSMESTQNVSDSMEIQELEKPELKEIESEEVQKIVIGLDGNQEEIVDAKTDIKMPKIDVDPAAVAPVAESISKIDRDDDEDNSFIEDERNEDNNKVEPLFKKLSAKIVDLESYALLAGGDILEDQLGSTLRNKLNNLQKVKKNPAIESNTEIDSGTYINLEGDELSAGVGRGTDNKTGSESQSKSQLKSRGEINEQKIDLDDSDIKASIESVESSHIQSTGVKSGLLNLDNIISKIRLIVEGIKAKLMVFWSRLVNNINKKRTREHKRIIHEPKTINNEKPVVVNSGYNYSSNSFTNLNLKDSSRLKNLSKKRQVRSRNNSKNLFGGLLNKLRSIKLFDLIFWQNSYKYILSNPQQIGIGFAVIGIVGILAIFMLGPSAQIQVVVAQQSLPVVATITASTDNTVVDNVNLTMPMYVLDRTDSRSETAPATGTKEVGERATTTVTISNDNNNPVTLTSGTTLSLVGRDINYRITQDITIPSAERSTNVPVEAVDIGSQFNVNNNSYKTFSIAQGKVSAFTYSPITGGSSEERVAVTQADIDGISEQLVSLLQNALSTELNGLLSEAERKLDNQIIFGEPSISASQNPGDVAETVDVTVELSAKVRTIRLNDLSILAETIAKQNGDFSGDFVIDNLDEIEFTVSNLGDSSATIELNTNASLSANLTSEEVAGYVLGMSVSKAEGELQNMPDTVTSELEYSPKILPKFMARVPNNPDKVDVKIVKANP